MIGIILSAGVGSRLLPLTLEMPKCLVEVQGKSILDHQLEALAEAGVQEAVVVGGYRHHQIADHLADHPPPLPASCVFNPFWSVSSSIGSVWAARDRLDAPFCLMNGDTVFAPGIIRDAVARMADGVSLLVEPLDTPIPDDMLVATANGRIVAVGKDLPVAIATHRSLGVILSSGGRAYAEALQEVIGAPGGVQAYHHAVVARLAGTGSAKALTAEQGRWQEVDQPDDIARWRDGAGR